MISLCFICLRPTPEAFSHVHHKTPKAADGGDERENLIRICAGCHSNIHRIADMLKRGDRGPALDAINGYYQNVTSRERAIEFANQIASSMTSLKEGSLQREFVEISLNVPYAMYLRLKALALDYKVEGKRRASTGDVVLLAVREYFKKLGVSYGERPEFFITSHHL